MSTDFMTRRDVFRLTSGVAVAMTLPSRGSSQDVDGALSNHIYYSPVRALAAAIREGRQSAAEVVDACLARIESVNPALNAVVQLRSDEARAEADRADHAVVRGESLGPLHGVPRTIKDSLATEGLITTGGSTGRARFVPSQDATVVGLSLIHI